MLFKILELAKDNANLDDWANRLPLTEAAIYFFSFLLIEHQSQREVDGSKKLYPELADGSSC